MMNLLNVTLSPGKGNDTVVFDEGNSRSVFMYANGDGNDSIFGFDNFSEGIIRLTSGSISSYTLDNGNHILRIGRGSITLANVKNDGIRIRTRNKNYRYVNGRAFNDPDYNGNNFYTTTPVKGTTADDFINVGGQDVTIKAGVGNDYIVNDAYVANRFFVINGEDGDDTITNVGSYCTLNGGAGSDVIHVGGFQNVVEYKQGDGNDTVFGYDDNDSLNIDARIIGAETIGNDVILKFRNGSIVFKDVNDKNLVSIENVIPSEIDNTPELIYNDLTKKIKIHNSVTLDGGWSGTLFASDYDSSVKRIDASNVNEPLYIIGNRNANSIIGGSGNNTLDGGIGNDMLIGGNGNDVFLYRNGEGKDIVADYVEGEDEIKIASGTLTKITPSGKNVVLTVGRGTITVKNAKNQKLTVTDAEGNTSKQIYGSKMLNIEDDDGAIVNAQLNTFAVTLNAEARTADLNLIGNAKANVIRTGEGNSTITTGKGNDTLIYSGGNVVVTDYTSLQDKIKFNELALLNASLDGTDAVLTTERGVLRVNNVKGRKITFAEGKSVVNCVVGDINTVTGSNAADKIFVGNDANFVNGGKGNDTVFSGSGANTLDGGAGNDLIRLAENHDRAIIIYSGGNDTVTDFHQSDSLSLPGGVNAEVNKLGDNEYSLTFKKKKKSSAP